MSDKETRHRTAAREHYRRKHGVQLQNPCPDCQVMRESVFVGRCDGCDKRARVVRMQRSRARRKGDANG